MLPAVLFSNMRYLVDTNIWIDVGRGNLTCADLKEKTEIDVVLAPPVVIELVRGVVRGGGRYFSRDQSLFRRMTSRQAEILQLPRVFVSQVLWGIASGNSGVLSKHYRELMDILIQSKTFTEFLVEVEKPNSVWQRMSELHSIHEGILEKELRSLERLADGASVKALAINLAKLYKCCGLLPDPESFEEKFSAAIEFLRSSMIRIRNGANPRKNDRGMYVDQQLFFYLADPEIVIVTKEDFSSEIKTSPQAPRIISYETFCRL